MRGEGQSHVAGIPHPHHAGVHRLDVRFGHPIHFQAAVLPARQAHLPGPALARPLGDAQQEPHSLGRRDRAGIEDPHHLEIVAGRRNISRADQQPFP